MREVVAAAAAAAAQLLRSFFAGLWPLDDLDAEGVKDVVDQALQRPHDFVVKPQREGGGNNLYDKELYDMLYAARRENGGSGGLPAYILMQRILPPPATGILARHGKPTVESTLSELGVYGTFVRRGNAEVMINAMAGHLVRTKAANSNEGGVAAGFAVLNSPYLYP
mmetsp:Transcript_5254/g.9768  ORF Transcript_5254/g.9768 Transcript_5254/m.9768 type:complete len:167 (-) Transcript_5254:105-605(-)